MSKQQRIRAILMVVGFLLMTVVFVSASGGSDLPCLPGEPYQQVPDETDLSSKNLVVPRDRVLLEAFMRPT
jgi:hypothetical protein